MKQGIEFGLGPQSNGTHREVLKRRNIIGFCFARSLRPQCEIRGKAVNPGKGCGGDVGDIN